MMIIITRGDFLGWRWEWRVSPEGLEHRAKVQSGGVLPAPTQMPHSSSPSNGNLCTSSCCRQVLLLVLCVSAEEYEIFRGNCVLWTDIPEVPLAGKEAHLAALWLPQGTHAWTGGARNHSLQGPSGSATLTWKSCTAPGAHSIQIGKVEDFPASKGRIAAVKRFHDSKIKFPGPHWILHGQHQSCFTTKSPNTFFRM